MVISQKEWEHASERVEVQVPYPITLGSCEHEQYWYHFHVSPPEREVDVLGPVQLHYLSIEFLIHSNDHVLLSKMSWYWTSTWIIGIYPTVFFAGIFVENISLNTVQLVLIVDFWRMIFKAKSVTSVIFADSKFLSGGSYQVFSTCPGKTECSLTASMLAGQRFSIAYGTSSVCSVDGLILSNIRSGAGPHCHAATCVACNVSLPSSISLSIPMLYLLCNAHMYLT